VKYIVTVVFAVVFALTAPVCLVVCAVLWLIGAIADPDRHWVHAFLSRWGFQYFRVNPFWRIRVEGRERIPDGPSVLVVNHQSLADVVAVLGLYRRFKFVSKASLFQLPLVGWSMGLARYMRVVRGRPHSTQLMLEDCRAWLRRGVAVLIFPEGTYAPPGRLLPFKRGAFRLAIEERVPLVPVVLEGTRGLVLGDGPWLEPRSRIRVRVLPPWPSSELGTDEGALADRVRELYRRELDLPPDPAVPAHRIELSGT
jgi:1-acyl-sn-glycerol-3-phosphate acyltransferase